jgi:hypothetical protein
VWTAPVSVCSLLLSVVALVAQVKHTLGFGSEKDASAVPSQTDAPSKEAAWNAKASVDKDDQHQRLLAHAVPLWHPTDKMSQQQQHTTEQLCRNYTRRVRMGERSHVWMVAC